MSNPTTDSAKAWSESTAVDYYAKHRHQVTDLYPSEKVFLPRALFPGARVLDVGCASGGFFNIMRTLEPTIEYTGIDIAEPSIQAARQLYPEANFMVTDGLTIPFDDNEFDLVHCTSVLVIEPRYQDVIREMYRVSRRFVLADMRLLNDPDSLGNREDSLFKIQFEGEFEGTTVPYVVSDADEVVNFILSMDPRPRALRGTGYYHAVSPMASTPFSEVCMTIFLVQKGDGGIGRTELELSDLPLEFSIDKQYL